MKIYESAVRKPISTMLIFVAVIIFGLFSLNNLAIDQYPDMDAPYVTVFTTYPGANAADIETNVTRVLEDQLNTVNNLKKLTSKSSDNYSMVTLEMEWGSDLTEATNDVRDVINRVTKSLPDGVDNPVVFKFSSSMMPILIYSVTADESYAALNKILDDKLVNSLNRINGVGAVNLGGVPEREIQINVDPNKLEAYNLTVESLGQIIAAENVNIPAGTMDIGNNTFNVKADGEFDSSDVLRSIVVSNRDGRTVMLKDVAEIKDTLEKASQEVITNGRRGMVVVVQKQSGANSVEIVKQVKKRMPGIIAGLPSDVRVTLISDSSETIIDSINALSETVMFAFLFVILVVMFFLGRWRATFIICLTIPISLVTAFIYLFATGSTLNIISLSSLSIAIGMVVDDAIVVLENITTHIEKGSNPKEAAIYGTNEVWLSVIATTLVIVAVFMPLTMLSGMSGIMFRELGWIVSIVCCVSTVAAISLTPMLSAYMLKIDGGNHTYKGIGVIYKPVDKFLDWLDDAYARMLNWCVCNRKKVFYGMMALFLASIQLLKLVPTEFFPPQDNASITAEVELEQNLSMEYTSITARKIDKILDEKYPEIYLHSATTGASDGSSMFSTMTKNGSHVISYRLRLPRLSEREGGRTIFEISDLLRKDLAEIPEVVRYTVTPGGQSGGVSGASNLEVKVFGYDMNTTDRIANDLKGQIAKVEGMRDVQLSRDDLKPEFNVVFDREKLAYYGMNGATASTFVRNRINGYEAAKYREDGDEYDIVVRYAEPFRESLESIENITLYSSTGQPVKLREVADIREEFAAPSIDRENRQRVISVKATLGSGTALGSVIPQIKEIVNNYPVPDGIAIEVGGSVEDQQDAFGDLMILLVLIILLVYIVMATQFESLKMPFIIMMAIPFAFTGVFVALWISGTPLSIIALIGAIMLVGIVVKNGIVMVDYTNLLIERGSGLFDAVVAAGKSRLRPVLMTSLTTILGMVPMAMGIGNGSELWQPMGVAVIGGMTCSTFLTLLVVPVLYAMMNGTKQEKLDQEERLKQERLSAKA